jgi:hypothetical protein
MYINNSSIAAWAPQGYSLGRITVTLAVLLCLYFLESYSQVLIWNVLSHAFLDVTVFIGVTLLVFYSLEHIGNYDTKLVLEKYKNIQIPLAALLGALPGCSGAIIVVTQYSIGRARFGSVIAALISTMGDAAFLLMMSEPTTSLLIISLSIVVGCITGFLIERKHGENFMITPFEFEPRKTQCHHVSLLQLVWVLLLIAGFAFSIEHMFHGHENEHVDEDNISFYIGATGTVVALLLWSFSPSIPLTRLHVGPKKVHQVIHKVTSEVGNIAVWITLSFLLFEMILQWTGWEIRSAFTSASIFLPLVGVLIGLIPGSAPQILTTGLYLQGAIPLSAQLGNAISNDGDALFPAIAKVPKASAIATIYTAIPGLIIGYLFYFTFEF